MKNQTKYITYFKEIIENSVAYKFVSNPRGFLEELFVYAILCGLGLEKHDIYRENLEQLFELNPTDEILLDLCGRTYKDALLHIHSIMNEYTLNRELVGKCLM